MTAATTSLTDFLLARIAEDEYDAHRATPLSAASLATDSDGRLLVDPARVLADCEAKRQIVDNATNMHTSSLDWDEACQILAMPYVDHPDYNPDWRP